jgi:hypothetical protein
MAIIKLALILLMALTAVPLALGASKKDNDQDGNYYPVESMQVYQHTYDEVFQACQEAIERKGWFVTDQDKDKGTIGGHIASSSPMVFIFVMHIEPLNTKPQTRVTINAHWSKKLFLGNSSAIRANTLSTAGGLLSEVQKVLATYH